MSATVYPITGSTFLIEAAPVPGGLGAVQISISSRSGALSPAGIVAAVGQINTYYATSAGAKGAAVARAADRGLVAVAVSPSTVAYTALAADVTAQRTAWTTILRTAANIA